MSKSTRFSCPNCDKDRSVVVPDGSSTTEFTCPNCDEPIVVSFGSN